MTVALYHGDNLDIFPLIEDESVDTIITDPPYGLAFMGKDWDHGVPGVPYWAECLRVSKPGAMLCAFGGTRTHHRLMCAIEDAGWEIRDVLMWVYGSGFPKSHDISKAIDKLNGRMIENRLELAEHIKDTREQSGHTRTELNKWCGGVLLAEHWESISPEFVRVPRLEHWNILKHHLPLSNKFDWLIERIEAEREVIGHSDNQIHLANLGNAGYKEEWDITSPATDAAALWNGWGTALKPAYEPIILAMKPLPGTFAQNALEYGVAGIWVDGCRIGTAADMNPRDFDDTRRTAPKFNGNAYNNGEVGQYCARTGAVPNGRWPANLLLSHAPGCECVGVRKVKGSQDRGLENTPARSWKNKSIAGINRVGYASPDGTETIGDWRCVEGCPVRLLDEGSGERPGSPAAWKRGASDKYNGTTYNNGERYRGDEIMAGYADKGGASRFFTRFSYSAKASRRERELGLLDHIPCLKCGGLDTLTHINPKTGKEEKCRRNGHPTVKPLDVCRWLCRLTKTPTGGVVLDPFMGSGRIPMAAILEGRDTIGIELERPSFEIAQAGVKWAEEQIPEMVQARMSL